MRFEKTPLDGAWVVELERRVDDRGWFARSFCEREFAAHGLPTRFRQSNISHNARAYTLRGIHFNAPPHEESKLVRCSRGAIHDVIVDLRPESPTRHSWFGIDLTEESGTAVFAPAGFGHAFLTLCDRTDVTYDMGAFYEPAAALGIRWDDPTIGIEWPSTPVVISERDAAYPHVGGGHE